MRPDDIKLGATYRGGKNGELRTAVNYGSSKAWLCWAPTSERLPLGGFVRTKCTSTESFAKWATEAVDVL